MSEINEPKNYIKSQFYLKDSENRIKEQILLNNDLYIITYFEGKWKLFLNGKKICENRDHDKIYERIPIK
jgi:hypothetical protein